MKKNGKKIGYKRVSTLDQRLDAQLDGIDIDKYFTEKISAKNTDRPELNQLLDYVREGDEVYVASMDRLARSLLDLMTIVKNLNEINVQITFVRENMTFTGDDSPMSTVMLQMMGCFAELERNLMLQRQRPGIERARKEGKYKGAPKKLSSDDISQLNLEIKYGSSKQAVAEKFGISRRSVYNYMK